MERDSENRVVSEIIEIQSTPSLFGKLRMFTGLVGKSFSISSSFFGNALLFTMGFITLNLVGKSLHQAAFGLCVSYYNMFVSALMLSSLDKYGIDLSVSYGSGCYQEMKAVTSKGAITMAGIFLSISLPLMLKSEDILLFAGISDEVAQETSRGITLLIGIGFLQVTAEMIKTFCIAQGHESVFALPGYINTGLSLVSIYYLVVVKDYKFDGWLFSKYINEIINLVTSVVVLFCYTEKECRGFAGCAETARGFKKYFCETFKFLMGSYAEYLAYEITTYFVALTHDNAQIAAYTCIYNVTALVYCIGISMGFVCRTRISILLGMGRPLVAKAFFKSFYRFTAFFGLLLCSASLLLRERIADLYSSNDPEQRECFLMLLTTYSLFMPSETSLMTASISMKTIGKVRLLLILNLLVLLGLNSAGTIMIYQTIREVEYYFLCIQVSILMLNVSAFIGCSFSDWTPEEMKTVLRISRVSKADSLIDDTEDNL